MVVEFLVAIASGIVTTLIAAYIQKKTQPPESAVEIHARSEEILVHRTTIHDGPVVYEETDSETRIREITFQLPPRRSLRYQSATSLGFALVVFLVVLALLVVL